jgi:hypothetical protein
MCSSVETRGASAALCDAHFVTSCLWTVQTDMCMVGHGQEWNISRGELDVLSALGLLSEAEVERCVVSAWNPVSVASTPAIRMSGCVD